MTRATAALSTMGAARVDSHLSTLIHHPVADIVVAGVLLLLGARMGAELLTAAQPRRPEPGGYAQGYIDGIEYRYRVGATETDTGRPPA